VLFNALSYIRSSWTTPGSNARLALEKAVIMTDKVTKAVDSFVDTEWKQYQEKVKTLEVKIFKE
jgi:hypothetical protein